MDFRSRIMNFFWKTTYKTAEVDRELWIETLFMNNLDL